jgi:hypothetical protein
MLHIISQLQQSGIRNILWQITPARAYCRAQVSEVFGSNLMRLKHKNITKIGTNGHLRTNSHAMPAMNTGIGNFAGGNSNGIGRAIFFAFQAPGTFFKLYKGHNNQVFDTQR